MIPHIKLPGSLADALWIGSPTWTTAPFLSGLLAFSLSPLKNRRGRGYSNWSYRDYRNVIRHPHDAIRNLIGFDLSGVVGLRNLETAGLRLTGWTPAAARTGGFSVHLACIGKHP